jgi:cell wall-associated NlpC family hydrolase
MRRLFVLLLGTAATACATTGATPHPFPVPSSSPPTVVEPTRDTETSPSRDPYAVSGTALSLRGVPYKNGGSDPSGFDCSGFVWYVFDHHGIHLPRTVAAQLQSGMPVDPADVRAGDLVFFDTVSSGGRGAQATHVGISIGGDEFVHAPSTTGQVRVEHLGSSYWGPRFLEARRIQ